MNSGEEIITLQFGSFANFIGTHYFNIQEAGFSYNPDFIPDILPDRLFRSSKDVRSGSILNYTPRTVLVDDEIPSTLLELPENIDDVETALNLSDDGECSSTLSNQKAQKTILKPKKSSESVQNWTDILNIPLHRRSYTFTPKECSLSCPESSYYHGFHYSREVSFWEKFEDNIRFFAEECDTLQGFQLITEGHTAYSGVASSALDYLKDEYLKKVCILTPAYFLPESATYSEKNVYLYNTVSFLAEANDNADLIVPISMHDDPWKLKGMVTNHNLKNINYKGYDKYENSAVLATALEYVTLPYRKRDERNISMSEYCQINVVGRSISNAGIIMPFPVTKDEILPNILSSWNGSFFHSISPFCSFEPRTSVDIMYILSKGLSKKKRNLMDQECTQELDSINTFIQTFYSPKMMKDFLSTGNFRIPSNFPDIFNNTYNLSNRGPGLAESVGRISEFNGIGTLVNCNDTKNYLESLCSRALMSFRKSRLASELSSEIDFNFIIDRLVTLASNYSDNHEL